MSVAAGVNILIGMTAYSLRFDPLTPARIPKAPTVTKEPRAGATGARFVMPALFFTTGLVVVGAEIFWSRFLSLVIRDSVTTYTITLAVVLTGIVLGSLLAARLAARPRRDREPGSH